MLPTQCTYEDGSCLQVVSLFWEGERKNKDKGPNPKPQRATPKMGHKWAKEQKVQRFKVSSPPPLSFPAPTLIAR